MKKTILVLLLCCIMSDIWAGGIPATPVMTLYRFNGALDIPYYSLDTFRRSGPVTPAGTLAQGSSVVPCLVVNGDQPLTDSQGIPFVGFEVIVDSRTATPATTARYNTVTKERRSMSVANHHCDAGVRFVLDVRNLYAMNKAPFFDPPRSAQGLPAASAQQPRSELDRIVRAFHNSAQCDGVNRRLTGRRAALQEAWNRFVAEAQGRWSGEALHRAKQLDYTMRTAIFEGHLERGCNAYGACERNIIALSIRNRGREGCAKRLGCSAPGDFQGVSSAVSQYNIWDEYLTQISGLTSCYLRDDLAGENTSGVRNYTKLQAMHAQTVADVERILFGGDQDLAAIFPNNGLADLKSLKHYYHAPAMGKCFPQHDRVEYISGAVAGKGNDYALLANTRIRVDQKTSGGYLFRDFVVREDADRDVISLVDKYPGFVVDARRVSLQGTPSRCVPYGTPSGCRFDTVGRYRKTPSWVNAGKPLEVHCRIGDRGEQCQGGAVAKPVRVGGVCDTQMRPFAGVE